MPDDGTYDVAVLPGSQDGQGKACIALNLWSVFGFMGLPESLGSD